MTETAGGERVGARKIHTDKPVGAGTGERRLFEVEKVSVVAQVSIGALDTGFVEGVKQNALDGLGVAEEVQKFVNEELPFAVGVAGVNNFVRLRDKIFDDAELVVNFRIYLEFPDFGNNRQIVGAPVFVAGVIFFRRHLLQNVPDEPGNNAVFSFDKAFAVLRFFKAVSQLARHRRLFGDVQSQIITSKKM